mmetsp:Transcript_58673/g.122596  ORF Transcript_58673/g.122596 Transcript_58673/m.122596 type:complete len:333 (+) Transcript_58673:584-1582(+)
MSSRSTLTHFSAARSSLSAHRPMAATALRTIWTSTSEEAYSLSSISTWSRLRSVQSMTMTSTFSSFTYVGSLYLQKNTLVSPWRMWGQRWHTSWMLRSATYCISGSEERRVTRGGASFLATARAASCVGTRSMNRSTTLTAERTTAALACWRRGVTRSMMLSASRPSSPAYTASASRITTCPHSEHSLSAASSFCSVPDDTVQMLPGWPPGGPPLAASISAISQRAATALATTVGLESPSRPRSSSRNPCSLTRSGLMSKSFVTHVAAVLRTYGSSSLSALRRGLARYSVIWSTRMHPIVRTARARMSGFGSDASLTNVLTAMMARSGWLLA